MAETKQAIVAASNLPLSIIIVGVNIPYYLPAFEVKFHINNL